MRIRPRSALGLKYVELVRGTSDEALAEGTTIATRANAVGPELDDFFSIFDEPTRENVDRNLDYFGTALAGRGAAINRTLGATPQLLGDLPPVMRTLANPDTRLVRLLDETADVTRVLAPLSDTLARGFTGMADTFEALSRDPQALRETIARSPATLQDGDRVAAATPPVPDPPGRDLRRGPGHGAASCARACRRSTGRSPPARRCCGARRSSPRTSRARCARCARSRSRRRPTSRSPA